MLICKVLCSLDCLYSSPPNQDFPSPALPYEDSDFLQFFSEPKFPDLQNGYRNMCLLDLLHIKSLAYSRNCFNCKWRLITLKGPLSPSHNRGFLGSSPSWPSSLGALEVGSILPPLCLGIRPRPAHVFSEGV